MSKLEHSVDRLFEEDPISKEYAQKILELFLSNYVIAEKKSYNRFLSIIILWLFGLGLRYSIISEASIFGVKITDFSVIVVGLPFAAGALYYDMICNSCAASNIRIASHRLISHHWKKIYDNHLEILVGPQTFFTMEMFMRYTSKGFMNNIHSLWMYFIVITMLIVPLGCVVHLAYLAITVASGPLWLSIGVVALTGLMILRSMAMIVQAVNYGI